MELFRLSPAAVPSASPAVDAVRPPSRYQGPCVVCREPVIGQDVVRVYGDVVHADCSTDRRASERMSSH